MPPTGRFAPSPSGPLHFGSLVAAVASYCQARSQQGRWLLRIENVDTPRVVGGAADQIQRDLEAFGFAWDGPVLQQSDQFEQYRYYLDKLLDQGDCYACECSRRSLREQGVRSGPLGQIYPGNCRHKRLAPAGRSIRLNTADAQLIGFSDQVYGRFELNLTAAVGDFVLRRVDDIYAYHLAVVVDDELQGVDEIVRGADLLENTCLHLLLQRKLGFATPRYLHVPLASNAQGVKLSKQSGAAAIDHERAPQLLLAALRHLGQPADDAMLQANPGEILNRAIAEWNTAAIPARLAASAETFGS
ncbi:MAG: tRNA glutamyl-Q(34) synthetase GluQRS [Gammaproteobacteria bacterium]|nr:tRNA glutamyl-Q(34) synthetase GluQRS [Gammaproteobacteria bacterium]MDH3534958.1 tRNA glutamyl-Q(34) synthetase GluQRS [Gammaproteobacteria bacterium]